MQILGMKIPLVLPNKQNTPRHWVKVTNHIYNHYKNTDMADCDYYEGRTVEDLNALNFLFNDCIPQLVHFGTLSRRSALYQDSKPFFNDDIAHSMDNHRDGFFEIMNKIMHHDMKLFFKKVTRDKKQHQNSFVDVLPDIIELMKRQIRTDEKHGYDSNSLQSYDMQNCNLDYAKWLNSRIYTNIGLEPVKVIIDKLTNHWLNTNDSVCFQTDTQNGMIPHIAITEFCGDPNGGHYLHTYSHSEFLQLLEQAQNKVNDVMSFM